MNTTIQKSELEAAADRLQACPDYRVLRAVPRPYSSMPANGEPPAARCLAILDAETTGLSVEEHSMIELAIMLVFVSPDGEIAGHFGPVSWLEDPGVPLDPRIELLTGLTDADLAGKRINDVAAFGLLDRADLLVAQNAKFDAAWIERRYPRLAGRAWACSCADIDWLELGYEGRAQQHLLVQHGWFANAHRAGDDAWSLFHLLRQRQADPGGGPMRTHLSRLIEAADTDTAWVEAVGAPYSAKDRLKARSYRWDAQRRTWGRELGVHQLAAERAWFGSAGLPMFTVRPMTARERHR